MYNRIITLPGVSSAIHLDVFVHSPVL